MNKEWKRQILGDDNKYLGMIIRKQCTKKT